jgi:hypothetical protein
VIEECVIIKERERERERKREKKKEGDKEWFHFGLAINPLFFYK